MRIDPNSVFSCTYDERTKQVVNWLSVIFEFNQTVYYAHMTKAGVLVRVEPASSTEPMPFAWMSAMQKKYGHVLARAAAVALSR